MRGAPCATHIHSILRGIIPADAGSTYVVSHSYIDERDHPRGCGEHSDGTAHIELKAGSSPRMRGALVVVMREIVLQGIIPADAGSTVPRIGGMS